MILSPFLMGTFIIVMIFWVMAALLDSNIANHAWQRLPWGKVVIDAAFIAVLVGATYFGSRYVTCSGLEDDYLNNISQMKSNASVLDLVQDKAGRSTFSAMRDAGLRRSEALIADLNAQCGSRAADTALRKGSAILLP